MYSFNDTYYLEAGLYGKYTRATYNIEMLSFTSDNLKAQLPIYAGYKLNDTWKFSLGSSIENNKDIEESDIRKEDNIRYELVTKVVYSYTPKIQFSFRSHWMLNNSPDSFTIASPRNGLYVGVIYNLIKFNKTKEEE